MLKLQVLASRLFFFPRVFGILTFHHAGCPLGLGGSAYAGQVLGPSTGKPLQEKTVTSITGIM